jgi:hypothetical protein
VDGPGHPAGGGFGGVRRHWGALQGSGYDAPGGPCSAGTGTGTCAARLAQALKDPPVGPAPSALGTALEGGQWRHAPDPPPGWPGFSLVRPFFGGAMSGAAISAQRSSPGYPSSSGGIHPIAKMADSEDLGNDRAG